LRRIRFPGAKFNLYFPALPQAGISRVTGTIISVPAASFQRTKIKTQFFKNLLKWIRTEAFPVCVKTGWAQGNTPRKITASMTLAVKEDFGPGKKDQIFPFTSS
jgi:hypothetical protein